MSSMDEIRMSLITRAIDRRSLFCGLQKATENMGGGSAHYCFSAPTRGDLETDWPSLDKTPIPVYIRLKKVLFTLA